MSNQSIPRKLRRAALVTTALVALSLIVPVFISRGGADVVSPQPPAVTLVHATLGTEPGSISELVKQTKPAVVTVETTIDMAQSSQQNAIPSTPFDEFFKRFFGDQGLPVPRLPDNGQGGGQVAHGLGSGFIIDPTGVIVTNNHVIDGATAIAVVLDDGTRLQADLVGHDEKSDLAVLRVNADHELPTVAWGDSDALEVGDPVVAIGNPFGIGTTVTSGIVSARGRDLRSGPYDDFIQVDAAINHGNSGGPLFDMEGKVVGINSAIYSPNGGNVGVGFSIPSSQAQSIVARLLTDGTIEHGFMGVSIQSVTDEIAGALGLPSTDGALVASVMADSPAAAAGVQSGDVVTAIGDQTVDTPKSLSRAVADMAPGTSTHVTVWREGKSVDVALTIGQNPADEQVAMNDQQPAADEGLPVASIGVGLSDVTPEVRKALGLGTNTTGVVVKHVEQGQPAAESGIREGDIIVSIGSSTVDSASDAQEQIVETAQEGKKGVLLLIERNGNRIFVAVPFRHA